MRDSQVYAMHEANARRNGLLLAQFSFLKDRQEALERVIKTSTLMNRIRWLINPAYFFRVWDAVTIHLQNESRVAVEKAAAKPRLTIVGANGHA